MSASALAEYLILKTDQQEKVLHDSRFSSPIPVIPYRAAIEPIRDYNADVLRPKNMLEAAKSSLKVKATDPSIRPKVREECLRCVETIELFEKSENAFGTRAMKLELAPRFQPLDVEGVRLSVQPDLIVRAVYSGSEKAGALVLRPQKSPDPEACRLEETKRQRGEHRREMARYILAMIQIAFEANSHLGEFDRRLITLMDIRMGERIEFPTSDYAARIRAIRAACRQIKALWDGIQPSRSDYAK